MGFLSGLGKAVGGLVSSVTGGDVLGLAGGLLSSGSNRSQAENNVDMQKEFAQNGIRWKVEDAKAAGIHPLYALGAQTHSFNPISVGDTSMGTALSNVGQDISRSIHATRTKGERNSAVMDALSLERAGLENDLLRAQIAKTNQVGPAMPSPTDPAFIPGQGDAFGPTKVSPVDLAASDPGKPYKEAGAISDMQFVRNSSGGVSIVPSKDWTDRGQDMFGPELGWAVRNMIMPSISNKYPKPPSSWLPKGATGWSFNPLTQEFYPVYGNRPVKTGRVTNMFK